ncbi:MAG TPA: Fic family protein [Thermoanaerobaculia bacterium]|nr:Fic family protein [Thermoanaerobaculia bacterium]
MVADDRHSVAGEPEIISDPVERAHRETRNGLVQAEEVLQWVETFTAGDRPFRLRPSLILGLHRTAMDGVTPLAGTWRNGPITISGSAHAPPPAFLVPELVEDLCEWVNDHWASKTAVEISAYVMWRMNWIHPFVDGNGRTARAVSYLALCAHLGYRLPGTKTIPEHIAGNKEPYYAALEQADNTNLKPLIDYVTDLLARQLLDVFESATRAGAASVDG